jgi:MarR family transcriptional regulator, lower aerobic nicotinate degradation pathway regulator
VHDDEESGPDGVIPARIADQPSWLISRAYARSNALLNAGFEGRGDGLRKYHYRLLAALEEFGPVSQIQLGRGTSVDRSDVVAVLDKLQELGLATREPDPADRRRNIVAITPAGSKQLHQLDAVIADIETRLLSPLPPSEREQFMRLLRLVVQG